MREYIPIFISTIPYFRNILAMPSLTRYQIVVSNTGFSPPRVLQISQNESYQNKSIITHTCFIFWPLAVYRLQVFCSCAHVVYEPTVFIFLKVTLRGKVINYICFQDWGEGQTWIKSFRGCVLSTIKISAINITLNFSQ